MNYRSRAESALNRARLNDGPTAVARALEGLSYALLDATARAAELLPVIDHTDQQETPLVRCHVDSPGRAPSHSYEIGGRHLTAAAATHTLTTEYGLDYHQATAALYAAQADAYTALLRPHPVAVNAPTAAVLKAAEADPSRQFFTWGCSTCPATGDGPAVLNAYQAARDHICGHHPRTAAG